MMKTVSSEALIQSARRTLEAEIKALEALSLALKESLGEAFARAVQCILNCQGRVIVMGLGKSGHIGRKIAATLASTGTPAFFVHAAEALHGDLGMITGRDVVIPVSYSGKGSELIAVMPALRRLGCGIIALTGDAQSPLAQLSDIVLEARIAREACPLNLAPTSSTTTALVLGDCLAIACLEARDFGPSDFAQSHPGGALGRRLLTRAKDVMRTGSDLPIVAPQAALPEVLKVMSAKRMGLAIVCEGEAPIGILTDGDLRRLIEKHGDIRALVVQDVMTPSPRCVEASTMAVDVASLMEQNQLNHMLITEQGRLVGALHMHDLMQAKVI